MNRNYNKGILFFILSLIVSIMNDIIQKVLGRSIDIFEITFFRNFFGSISLIPIILYYGKNSIKTRHIFVQITRGFLLFLGISAWILGLKQSQIAVATTMGSTVPFFTLILAYLFLSERVVWQRWVATLIGFIGVIIVAAPVQDNISMISWIFVFSAFCFACLDIINKKFVTKESMICMLFYSALFTAAFSVYPACYSWSSPSWEQLNLLIILGINANLILYFLLKAFTYVDVSATAPYRYLEFVFAAIAGFVLFNDILTIPTLIGAAIIIPATFIVIYSENRK